MKLFAFKHMGNMTNELKYNMSYKELKYDLEVQKNIVRIYKERDRAEKIIDIFTLIIDNRTSKEQGIKLIDKLFLQEYILEKCKKIAYHLENPSDPDISLTIKSPELRKYFLSKYNVLYKQELDKKINCVLYGDNQNKES